MIAVPLKLIDFLLEFSVNSAILPTSKSYPSLDIVFAITNEKIFACSQQSYTDDDLVK
jgi:hypothetical protein